MSRLLSFSKIKLKLGPPESIPAVKLFCLNERCRTQIVIWIPFNITQRHQLQVFLVWRSPVVKLGFMKQACNGSLHFILARWLELAQRGPVARDYHPVLRIHSSLASQNLGLDCYSHYQGSLGPCNTQRPVVKVTLVCNFAWGNQA